MSDPIPAEIKEQIDQIVQNYVSELMKLRKEHHEIISSFEKALANTQIEKIRKSL